MPQKKMKITIATIGLAVILVSLAILPGIFETHEISFSGFIAVGVLSEHFILGHLDSGDKVRCSGCFSNSVICGITTVSLAILYTTTSHSNSKDPRNFLLQTWCSTRVTSAFPIEFSGLYSLLICKSKKNISVFYNILCQLFTTLYAGIRIPMLSIGISITCSSLLSLISDLDQQRPSLEKRKGKLDYVA